MPTIPRLPPEEFLYVMKREKYVFRQLMCQEQKKTAWMKENVQKLTKTGQSALEASNGSSLSPRAVRFSLRIEDLYDVKWIQDAGL